MLNNHSNILTWLNIQLSPTLSVINHSRWAVNCESSKIGDKFKSSVKTVRRGLTKREEFGFSATKGAVQNLFPIVGCGDLNVGLNNITGACLSLSRQTLSTASD